MLEGPQTFDSENVRWLNMTVAMMLRYAWYGSLAPLPNTTQVASSNPVAT